MSQHAADKNHGGQPSRYLRTFVVNGVDDEIVPTFDGTAKPFIKPANQETRDGKRINDEFVIVSKGGRTLKEVEKKRRGGAAKHSYNSTNSNPLHESF